MMVQFSSEKFFRGFSSRILHVGDFLTLIQYLIALGISTIDSCLLESQILYLISLNSNLLEKSQMVFRILRIPTFQMLEVFFFFFLL